FHLYAGNRAKMSLVTRQFSRGGADQNIYAINSREPLEPRRQINRVADDRGVHPFVRTNIADDHFALIDADAHAEPHTTLFAPFLIELPQLPPHPPRRTNAIFCVLRHAKTAHVSPHSHDRVADKFIEGPAITEN